MPSLVKALTDVANLPRPIRLMLLGQGLSALGSGLVLPFAGIYLHFVRAIPIAFVGLVLSTPAIASIAATILGGGFIQRIGPRRVVLVGLLAQALGYIAFAGAVNVALAFTAAFVVGIGNGLFFPAMNVLIAGLTSSVERTRASAAAYAITNLGLGTGAAIAGITVSINNSLSFIAIYLANAMSFLMYGLAVIRGVPSNRVSEETVQPGTRRFRGWLTAYKDVARNHPFRLVLVIYGLIVLMGTQMNSSVPLYAKVYLGIQPSAIGLIFAANTAFIVVAQLPIAHQIEGRRRTSALMVLCGIWFIAWSLALGGSFFLGAMAAAMLALCYVVLAVGECVGSATVAPLAMDLSPTSGSGHHMAALSVSWSAGQMLGPAIGTFIVGTSLHQILWFGLLTSAVVTFLLTVRLNRLLLH